MHDQTELLKLNRNEIERRNVFMDEYRRTAANREDKECGGDGEMATQAPSVIKTDSEDMETYIDSPQTVNHNHYYNKEETTNQTQPAPQPGKPNGKWKLPLAIATVALASLGGVALGYYLNRPVEPDPTLWSLQLVEDE